MFEKASRLKLRFETSKGILFVEDLWDLSLTDLNKIAKSYNKTIKESEEEDFLREVTKEDKVTKLKFDIVLHILTIKKEEKEAAAKREEKKAKKQKILEILAKKQDETLEGKSEEELLKELEELDN
jgi:hypothetical protein